MNANVYLGYNDWRLPVTLAPDTTCTNPSGTQVYNGCTGSELGHLFTKNLGGTAVYAETSERELYAPTRHFYESCGYEKEAVLKDFYDVGDSKAVYVIHI